MITFEEVDDRLAKIGKNRAWLVQTTGQSEGSIRSALAPNAQPKHRSKLLRIAITDAIEREELEQAKEKIRSFDFSERLTINCSQEDRQRWENAARLQGLSLDQWIKRSLKTVGDQWKAQTSKVAETPPE